jgi:hypothetical protein
MYILVFIGERNSPILKRCSWEKGNQYRYILVKSKTSFPKKYIQQLLKEAYVNALAKVKDPSQIREGLTITKSISGKKRELKSQRKK